jgi:hypothetical protein
VGRIRSLSCTWNGAGVRQQFAVEDERAIKMNSNEFGADEIGKRDGIVKEKACEAGLNFGIRHKFANMAGHAQTGYGFTAQFSHGSKPLG